MKTYGTSAHGQWLPVSLLCSIGVVWQGCMMYPMHSPLSECIMECLGMAHAVKIMSSCLVTACMLSSGLLCCMQLHTGSALGCIESCLHWLDSNVIYQQDYIASTVQPACMALPLGNSCACICLDLCNPHDRQGLNLAFSRARRWLCHTTCACAYVRFVAV